MLVKLKNGHFVNALNIEQLSHSYRHTDGAENLTIQMTSGTKIELKLDHAEVEVIKNAIDKALSK